MSSSFGGVVRDQPDPDAGLRASGAGSIASTHAEFGGRRTHCIGASREQSRAAAENSGTHLLDHLGRYASYGQRDPDAGRCVG